MWYEILDCFTGAQLSLFLLHTSSGEQLGLHLLGQGGGLLEFYVFTLARVANFPASGLAVFVFFGFDRISVTFFF